MLIDRRNCDLEQHRHQFLRKPDGFIRHAHLDAVLARLPGEDQKLGGAVADLEFVFFLFHGLLLKFGVDLLNPALRLNPSNSRGLNV